MPIVLICCRRFQDVADRASAEARASIDTLLSDTGLSDIIALRTRRRVLRANHLEVWVMLPNFDAGA